MSFVEVPEDVLLSVERRVAGCGACPGAAGASSEPVPGTRHWFLAALIEDEYRRLHPEQWDRSTHWHVALDLGRRVTCPGCGRALDLSSTVVEACAGATAPVS